MASGIPVLQPRHGSFPEVIERTGGGILIEPNNAKSLADEVYSLYQNPELAADLGRKGADEGRQHYSVARMTERAVEVYEQLLSQ
jgi:glycosyltransferase involved in cell wall biosynthesis